MRVELGTPNGPAMLNMIVQPLWDSALFGIANTAEVKLFQTPSGQSGKSLVDTNMVQGGQIPKPDEFYLRGFMIQVLPPYSAGGAQLATDITDMGRIMDKAYFGFTVGSNRRSIAQGHAQLFPCGLGLQGFATAGGGATYAYIVGNGVRQLSNRFALGDRFAEKLGSNESFAAAFTFPAGTLSLSFSITVRVYLPGLWGQSVG